MAHMVTGSRCTISGSIDTPTASQAIVTGTGRRRFTQRTPNPDHNPCAMMSIKGLFASCQRKAIPCPNWLSSGYGELEKQITFWATCCRTHAAPLLDFDAAHSALANAFQAGPPWLSMPMLALSSMVFSMIPAGPNRSSFAMSL